MNQVSASEENLLCLLAQESVQRGPAPQNRLQQCDPQNKMPEAKMARARLLKMDKGRTSR